MPEVSPVFEPATVVIAILLLALVLCGAILASGGPSAAAARPTPPARNPRAAFEGAVEALRQQGFETERMLMSLDGSVALFAGAGCGRACLLRPGADGKLKGEMRNLRTLASTSVTEHIETAGDTGFLGRLRGDPLPGTRRLVGADVRFSFDGGPDEAPCEVVLRFAPDEVTQARIAASSLRGERDRLMVADAKEEARSQAERVAAERAARLEEERLAAEARAREQMAEQRAEVRRREAKAARRYATL